MNYFFKISILTLFVALTNLVKSQNCSVNANVDFTICSTGNLTLNGSSGGLFTTNANWVQIGGPAVSISTPTSAVTAVTGFVGGNTYRFRLRAKCTDGSDIFDDVNVTVLQNTKANAGLDLPGSCPGTKTLSANAVGVGETGSWIVVGANNAGVTITTTNSPTSQITLGTSSTGTTTLRWTITNANGCVSFDDMTVINFGGVATVTAGPDQTLSNCYSATQSAILAGSYAGTGLGGQVGTWTMVSGPNYPTFANVNLRNTGVSNLVQGTYVFRWTVTGSCATGVDDVVINVPAPTQNVTTVSTSNQIFCSPATVAMLVSNPSTFANEVITWSQVSGPAGATITNSNNPSTSVTGLNGSSTYQFSVTITNTVTGCKTGASSTISFTTTTPSITMPIDVIGACGQTTFAVTYTTLGGAATQFQLASSPIGTSAFATANNPFTRTLTTTGEYNYLFRRFTNGIGCSSSADNFKITVSNPASPSNAGTSQNLACNVFSTTLSGNSPASGTGSWSQISGPNTAVLATPNINVCDVSGLTGGVYVFRWSIFGGNACKTNFADIKVTVANPAPTAAAAGTSQTICHNSQFQLSGNSPSNGEVGTWSVTPSSGVTISNVNNPTTLVSGLAASTTYTFTWKITNACGTSTSNVVYTTTSGQGPTNANAGSDQCLGSVTSAVMSGNVPSVGTGSWTTISGPNVPAIVTPTLATTSINGLTTGTYKFLWTISTGTCSATKDTVVVTINNNATLANAGTPITICNNSTSLAGNAPTVGTGMWTQVSGLGGVTIVTPTLATSSITGLTNNGDYVFQWTISNGACASNSSTVIVKSNLPPTTAIAGITQTICGVTNATLAGNTPTSGKGVWSLSGLSTNMPSITTPSLANTTVTGFNTGSYVFNWTISTGPLCPSSVSTVTIHVSAPANAGSDVNLCSATNVQLVGTPGSNGTWQQIGTTPSAVSTTSNSSYSAVVVNNMVAGTYTFQFNAPSIYGCAATTDQVLVNVSAYGTIPNAGPDQSVCLSTTNSVTLAGNTPTVGTGAWSLLTGPTGHSAIITSTNNPTSAVTNMTTTGIYVFNWNISSGSCSNFSDVVRVEIARAPSISNAGANNLNACATNFSLAANQPTSGIGVWSQVSGPSATVFNLPNQPRTTLSNLTAGTYQYVWTISTGTACPASTSTVSITFPAVPPTTPNAGTDINSCNITNTNLSGNVISIGTATWSLIGGPNTPTIIAPNTPTTSITGLVAGTYTLVWASSNGACIQRDTVKIINSALPNLANAGVSQTICPFIPVSLTANTPTAGTTGMWAMVSGPSTPIILTPTLSTSNVLGTSAGTYVFSWTISSLNCPSSVSNVTIVINSDCPSALDNLNTTIVNTPISGNVSTNDIFQSGATFSITTQPSNGTITINPANGQYTFTPTTNFTGVTTATYNLCGGAPQLICSNAVITITVYPVLSSITDVIITTPSVSTTGSLLTNDNGIVSNANYSVSVTQLSSITGTLTINSSTGQYTFTPNSSFTGSISTTYTVCNLSLSPAVCSATNILIYVSLAPVAVTNSLSTPQNTVTTGNLATNDLGANAINSPTFTVTQPASTTGTFVLNPSTGQYTFTPNTTFVGTGSTTYTLCNNTGSCSSTTITYTVTGDAPVAVTNSLTTPQNTVTTGNLATNDLGANAINSPTFTVTQPASTTGTFVLNPSTGQYTFTPNTTFVGTGSTTYTLCNNTGSCSSTTITYTVTGTAPVAVTNSLSTPQGTVNTGSLATNDTGANSINSPTFTVTQPSSTTGTITLNPSTGQYTFTPNPSFVGTGNTTYTLCNNTGSCSSTTITYTVTGTAPVAVTNSLTTPQNTVTTGNLATNDLGANAINSPTFTVTQPASTTGTFVLNPSTGQYTFTPNTTFVGTGSITYTLCNNTGSCSSTTITYTVTGDAPVAVTNSLTTPQNTVTTGNLATNDLGANAINSPTFTVTQPASTTGTFVLNPSTGQYTFTPNTTFVGTGSTTYTLCNNTGSCSSTTITHTVTGTAPVAVGDVISTPQGTTSTGSIAGNDTGANTINSPTFAVTQPVSTTGTITLDPSTGNYTFVPNPSFVGTSTTTYTLCNNTGNCSVATITITTNGVAPISVTDGFSTPQNTVSTGNIATNDTGANSVSSPTFVISQPASTTGTFVINPSTGQYTFTPNSAFVGTGSTTYTLCNNTGSCSSTTITYTVTGTAPVAVADQTTTTFGTQITSNLSTNDIGVNAITSPSFTATNPSIGTLTVDPATGSYTYTPDATFAGTVVTTYTVCNNTGCSTNTITIIVTQDPVTVNDATTTVEGTPVSGNVGTNDSGLTGATFTGGTTTDGTLIVDPATGNYTFTPNAGYTGTTTATYTLCNTTSTVCSTATLVVVVTPSIVTNPDVIVTTPSVIVTGNLTTNDLHTGIDYTVTATNPSTGTLTVDPATGSYTYTPDATFAGTVVTTYTVCNNTGCSTNTITIIVTQDPVTVNDATTTVEGTPVSGNVGTNDSGLTGATFTGGTTTDGTLIVDPATGNYTFTPNAGYTGTTTATYTLCNTTSTVCSTATLVVVVTPSIVTNPDVIVTTPSVIVTGNLTTNDLHTGIDYTVTATNPSTGTLTVDPATGSYTYTPDATFAGTVVTTYTVCNNTGCSTNTITIVVTQNPVAVNDATTTVEGTAVSGNVGTNDSGLTGATFTGGTTTDGTLIVDQATGNYTFTPNAGYTGTTTATYTLCNTTSTVCSTATLVIVVTPTTVIVANPDVITTTGTIVATGTLTLNDTGIGTTYTVTVSNPNTGTLTVDPSTGSYTYTPDPTFTGTVVATYTVCNNTGCSTSTITINSTVTPTLVLTNPDVITTTNTTTVTGNVTGNDTGLTNTYTVSVTPVNPSTGTLTIDPATGNYTFVPNPNYTGTTSTTYTVCNNEGCSTNTITIIVNSNPIIPVIPVVIALEVPQIFTPNGDGINDALLVKGAQAFPDAEIKIFNRWGNLVYEAKGEDIYMKPWNGKNTEGISYGGDDLPVGTYFYIIEPNKEGEEVRKGYIYLQR